MPHPTDSGPAAGYADLPPNTRGWLPPSEAWLRRLLLAQPELALVAESCPAEVALHQALRDVPGAPVPAAALAAVQDDDARANYTLFLRFRDGLLKAGSLEACYLGLMRGGAIDIPPVFVDALVQPIVQHLLAAEAHAVTPLTARAAELLFRPQRIATHDGQLLAGDRVTLDAQPPGTALEVLNGHSAPGESATSGSCGPYRFLIDLRQEVQLDLPHGLSLKMARTQSGLKALAQVLERWVRHFLGVAVHIRPLARVEDAAWRWHIGLDAVSSALLDDLYLGHPIAAERQQRLLSLFRLDFADPADMRPDVAGKPVYLGLAMDAEQVLKLKPQNLLLNLPLHPRLAG